MNRILISVVVPFHNSEEYIGRCAESLVHQDFDKERYELLFVDNGASDRSKEIVKSFSGITCLQEPAKGAYAARNKGLSIARGDIIAFTDSDCAVDRNWLQAIHDDVSRHGSQVLLGRRLYPGPRSTLVDLCETAANEDIRHLVESDDTEFYYGYTNNMAITRDVFRDVGSFHALHGEDTEYIGRCLGLYGSLRMRFVDAMMVTHLEITSFWRILKKNYKYGYNDIAYIGRRLTRAGRARAKERARYVFVQSLLGKGYGPWQRTYLYLGMKLMTVSWNVGRLKGILEFPSGSERTP